MLLESRLERARKKVILALDVSTLEEAVALAERLAPYVGMFKVGLRLLTAEGAPRVVEAIQRAGGRVFFDGKFDDIPATVGDAVKESTKLGVGIINVHASAGMPAMLTAVANKGRAKLYAVTVLTSIDEHNSNIVFGGPTKAKVLQMAREACLAGCDGIICSPEELKMLRACPELDGMKIMTPGIRPVFSQVNDQKRVMTPGEAVKAGADYLVIGRPITNPTGMTCEEAAEKVLQEIAEVLDDEENTREKEIAKIFADAQAIMTGGHFVYNAGDHGDVYVNKDVIYPHTQLLSKLCKYIAENFENEEIDAVIGPVVGGVSLSQWTAHYLSLLQGKEVFALCADKTDDEYGFEIKRGQKSFVSGGQKILVVEDILNSGGTVKKVAIVVRKNGGDVVGVGALCNRGNVTVEMIDVPIIHSLMNVTLEKFPADECPHCKNNVPVNTDVGHGKKFLEMQKERA